MPEDTPTLEARLEEFAVDFGLLLAGWVVNGPSDVTPFDLDQLGILTLSAVGAYARAQPDYDTELDITNVIQLGVHTYAEATRANFVALTERLSEEHAIDMQGQSTEGLLHYVDADEDPNLTNTELESERAPAHGADMEPAQRAEAR